MKQIYESGENYLETILILHNKTGYVRAVDVATELGFSKPSVSRAMSILKDAGHIVISREGQIELTESGRAIAEKIYERHRLLTEYLIAIGVDEKTAAEDACRMEHVISELTFQKLKEHAGRAAGPSKE